MFDQDLIEHLEEDDAVIDFKAPFATNYTKGQFSPFSPFPVATDNFPSFLDVSLDQEINKSNALQLRSAICAYMKHCLVGSIDETKMFQDGNLIPSQTYGDVEGQDEAGLEGLITSNQLLTAFRKKNLLQNFKEFQELKGLFVELQKLIGKYVTRELIFVMAPVLEKKIQDFRQLVNKQTEGFLPKMDRFWGDSEQENIMPGGWAVYQDLTYDDIKQFAVSKVEDFSTQIYFSPQLKFLNLREISEQVKPSINVMDKFTTLLVFLCENIFLSMCGMSQNEQDLQQFKQQLKLTLGERGEVFEDVICKRVKTE